MFWGRLGSVLGCGLVGFYGVAESYRSTRVGACGGVLNGR